MKHFTYDDRLVIQRGLTLGWNFSRIAAEIGKDRTSVSREIRAHLRYDGKEPVSAAVTLMLEDLLNYYKADMHFNTALKEIKEHSIIVESDGEVQEIEADTVVMATGFAEKNSLYKALEDSGKKIYIVGDAKKSPGNIMHSVADGNKVGREI